MKRKLLNLLTALSLLLCVAGMCVLVRSYVRADAINFTTAQRPTAGGSSLAHCVWFSASGRAVVDYAVYEWKAPEGGAARRPDARSIGPRRSWESGPAAAVVNPPPRGWLVRAVARGEMAEGLEVVRRLTT